MSTKFVLLDVEGTTTAVDFVHKTLFQYASARAEDFLTAQASADEVVALYPGFREYWRSSRGGDGWSTPVELADLVREMIAKDVKHPSLKSLQGLIWQDGYKSGELVGHVYEDVPATFRRWADKGLRIGIYSSGSVLAQRLIFGHSVYGDLNPWIEANFDTAVGAKREPESYRRIAESVGLKPEEILFLSDIPAELIAARASGLKTRQIVREGTVADPDFQQSAVLES